MKIKTTIMGLLLAMAGSALAQNEVIPFDPAIRKGKLDNGLTYYIRQNQWPEQRATFYIVQKVGSLQEEDSQRGLAHFLEHMCFNGTKSFPGNGVIRFAESFGARLGYELQAMTSIDRTWYYIDNVPTQQQSTLDSCLLVLHDWAGDLTLDPKEIDKERGVIHEEWRSRSNAQSRQLERNLPELYPGSKYGHRYPIGTMEVIDNFKYEELRNYYERWYHPSNQCVIVVGDIDIDATESKIREMFSSLPEPDDPEPVLPVAVPDNQEPIVIIDKDKEQTNAMLSIMFKRAPFPSRQKSNPNYLATKFVQEAIVGMLDERLEQAAEEAECPYAEASSENGEYIFSKTKDSFGVNVLPKGVGRIADAVREVMKEVRRAAEMGFNESEFKRFKDSYMVHVEDAYSNRDKQTNASFCDALTENFLLGEPVPSVEVRYGMTKEIVEAVTLDDVNRVIQTIIPETDKNVVILSLNPDKEGEALPTRESLLSALQEARTAQLAAVEEVQVDGEFIKSMPKAGTVTEDKQDPTLGYRQLTLSNGIKVNLKKTDFKNDEILMSGFGKGGSALYGLKDIVNISLFDDVIEASGLGGFSASELKKKLSGKKVEIKLTMPEDELQMQLTGKTRPADIETMLQLAYLYFTNITKDEKSFGKMKQEVETILDGRDSNPQLAFADSLQATIYGHNPRVISLSKDRLAELNYDRVLEMARERTASAEGWTFTIVGNIDEEKLVPMLCQYLGSLPAARRNTMGRHTKELASGVVNNQFRRPMETPLALELMMWSNTEMAFTPEHIIQAEIMGQLITMDYLETIREDEGIAYSAQAQGMAGQMLDGYRMIMLQSVCPTKPEKAALAAGLLQRAVTNLAEKVDEAKLSRVKKAILKTREENLKKNAYWLSIIQQKESFGIDMMNTAADIVGSQTPETIMSFMKDFLSQGNQTTVMMLPE